MIKKVSNKAKYITVSVLLSVLSNDVIQSLFLRFLVSKIEIKDELRPEFMQKALDLLNELEKKLIDLIDHYDLVQLEPPVDTINAIVEIQNNATKK